MMIYDFRFEPMLVEGVIIYETTLYCNCREYVYMLQLKFGNKGVENYAYKANTNIYTKFGFFGFKPKNRIYISVSVISVLVVESVISVTSVCNRKPNKIVISVSVITKITE